ncbi:hypothetical protein CC86DRAFT_408673 [Ophiobolus disseminans]|uniref:Uncharacterized protein n=1 Tax=Ophiobolus disseminans TaxID=1469910 RepID=A0A6A6ZRA9_9PLEO|nr:hypothetical protein CC86DRAFT_408673 [Ophiobolus disseminans]
MSRLQDYVSVIEFDADYYPLSSILGHSFLKWRDQKVITDFHANPEPSLSTLLAFFAGSGCENKRHRIFALLPLTDTGSLIGAGYDSDATDLCRVLLGLYMKDKTIDEMVTFGARLIEALDIREPIHENQNTVPNDVQGGGEINLWKVQIRRRHSTLVAPPVWGESTLSIQADSSEPEPQPLHHEQSMSCLFVGLFDAENVHVLEYAIEENDSGVTVKYARAYEYLLGSCQLDGLPPDEPGEHECRKEVRFCWLDRPSEDVYYHTGYFSHRHEYNPRLKSWKRPRIEILEEVVGAVSKNQPANYSVKPRLKPAQRVYSETGPWTGYVAVMPPDVFPAAKGHLQASEAYYREHGEGMPVLTISRSSTCRFVRWRSTEQLKLELNVFGLARAKSTWPSP